jgi:transposase
MAHANARLGPAGRRELVGLMIERGLTERQAAACLSVAPTTAHRWKQRWLASTASERASGAWAQDRSSRPRRSPARSSPAIEARVCAERERTVELTRLRGHSSAWAARFGQEGCPDAENPSPVSAGVSPSGG